MRLEVVRGTFDDFIQRARIVLSERILVNMRQAVRDREPLIWALALVLGIVVGYATIAFRWAIGIVQYPWLGTTSERVFEAAQMTPWWLIILAPTVGGVFVGYILDRYMPSRRGQGVADVIEAQALNGCRVDTKTGLLSAGLSAVSLGAGASVGREGPVVHLGATLASMVEQRFKLTVKARRTLTGSAVAGAVSASFNAPIAGVLFAHEVVLGHYSFRALVPTIISSVTAAVVARVHLGNYPAFKMVEQDISSYWEFPAFALLGMVCALMAIIFQLSVITAERVTWRFDVPLWARCGFGGLVVGVIGTQFPQVLSVGYDATEQALYGNLPLGLLLALIAAKTAATAISLASRFVGGVFSPSLLLGALTGSAFGIVAINAFPSLGSAQELYAVLGMGAVAAAVLGAPLSTTMIVFELTGGFNITIALLLTVSIACGLSQAVLDQSFFHWQLAKRGIFLTDGPHKSIMRCLRVADFMKTADAEQIASWQARMAAQREQIMADAGGGGAIELPSSGSKMPIGASGGQQGQFEAQRMPVTLTANDTLDRALRAFADSGLGVLP
ncbi:MAG: chloride channel protein, partial [Pseudomonadota bacterium]